MNTADIKNLFKPLVLGLVVGVVIAVVGPFVTLGRFPYGDAVLLAAYFGIQPLLGLSGILMLIPWCRERRLPGLVLGVAAALLMAVFGAPLANGMKCKECELAREFCQSLIPVLEEYKRQHGAYPENIGTVLTPGTKLPLYLRRRAFYFPASNDFSFAWQDSPGIPYCSGVANYHHSSNKWDLCADW